MSQIEGAIERFILDSFLFGDESRMPSHQESLVQTGVIDSTGVLELIEFLEEQFGIRVEETETVPANLDTIDNLTGFVARKTS